MYKRQHIIQIILPALKNNKIVICDRFIDSTLVYQGIARNLGIEALKDIQKSIINDAIPNLTIFFDINPKESLKRIKAIRTKKELNRLDLEDLSFHEKVYEGYQQLIKEEPKRIKRIDATKDLNNVCNQVKTLVIKFLEDSNENI